MIYRGVPYPLGFYFTSGDTRSFVWGGGGGGGWGILLCFVSRYFVFVILVLVVYSIVSCSHMSCVLFLVLHAVVGSV